MTDRVMIAGTNSGCGKTTITCAILQALVNRRLTVMSYKCGPDYIDPMFHSGVIGVPSRNLDGFFMDDRTIRSLIRKNSQQADISVIEGVMGYYDGLGMKDPASSYSIASAASVPVILVVRCHGMSQSVEAVIDGFTNFRKNSMIRGVIFNELPPSLYPELKCYCRDRGLEALGYFPKRKEAELKSRYLGLVTAQEVADLKVKMQNLASAAETYLDVDGILRLAHTAPEMEKDPDGKEIIYSAPADGPSFPEQVKIRIAVARDRAFCFYYEDNLDLLRNLGCEIVEFSPLGDGNLPDKISGLYLGGGYPELYAEKLEENAGIRNQIRKAVREGLPTLAECGGYMYLHRGLKDPDGRSFQMCDVLDGECVFTRKLQHFGYVTMTARKDNLLCRQGAQICAHEFHHYISDVVPDTFLTEKGGKQWMNSVAASQLTAGFPHIHFYSNPEMAVRYAAACREYAGRKKYV